MSWAKRTDNNVSGWGPSGGEKGRFKGPAGEGTGHSGKGKLLSIDGGGRTRGGETGVTGSDPGEARKGQITQGFAGHAEEFELHLE